MPVEEGEKTTLEFAPEAYNYNTTNDEDPRNLVLLCTSQGLAIQQDGQGAKKLFHHVRDGNGEVKRYWLEAESSSHKVGGSQVESLEEKADALKRKKAVSATIGTNAMGAHFNVLMTVQVPLKQQRKRMDPSSLLYADACLDCCESDESIEESCDEPFGLSFDTVGSGAIDRMFARSGRYGPTKAGKSSAARVSRGSEVLDGTWSGITVEDPTRHPNEHVTATIVMYYTCSGGAPSTEDVKSAIDDLEELYESLETSGKLAEEAFDFMKSELTVQDVVDINNKLAC